MTEDEILGTLNQGIKKSGAKISGEPTLKAVSPAFLEELEVLVGRASGGPPDAATDGPSIRFLPSREIAYEVKLAPTQVLKKLTVTYDKAGAKEYTPVAPGQKSPLVLIVPGRYALIPEVGDLPVAYSAEVEELGKAVATLKGDWPKSDKCFVVTLRNFQGDRKRMFEVIQDPTLVANPLDNVRLGNDLVFAFASLNATAADSDPGRINENNELEITHPTLRGRNPKRVWIFFPLDEKQMREELEKVRKLSEKGLPAEIRKNAVTATQAATLKPDDTPKWVELPAGKPGEFQRKIKLSDLPGLAKKYDRLWWLVVYEFDDGTPQVIKVKDATGEPTVAREQEFRGWQQGIQEMIKRPTKP